MARPDAPASWRAARSAVVHVAALLGFHCDQQAAGARHALLVELRVVAAGQDQLASARLAAPGDPIGKGREQREPERAPRSFRLRWALAAAFAAPAPRRAGAGA